MSESSTTSMHPPREHEAQPESPDFERAAALSRELAERRASQGLAHLHAPLLQRFDTSGAPGMRALQFGGKFGHSDLRGSTLDMPVSPYAPPQRQLSAVRQGAPMWPPIDGVPPDGGPAPKRKATPSDGDSIPSDLQALLDMHRRRGHIS